MQALSVAAIQRYRLVCWRLTAGAATGNRMILWVVLLVVASVARCATCDAPFSGGGAKDMAFPAFWMDVCRESLSGAILWGHPPLW